ncbi:hypothetical protein ACFW1M_18140 [Streptomyces inhibens]|uniref:hypothetical protein n=1 Tax=Streptomyces inhibens TaxID=2293571 RepID=UPI0036B609F8
MYLEFAPEQQRLRTKQRAYISRLGLAAPDARVLVRNPGGPSCSWLQQTGDVWQPVLKATPPSSCGPRPAPPTTPVIRPTPSELPP